MASYLTTAIAGAAALALSAGYMPAAAQKGHGGGHGGGHVSGGGHGGGAFHASPGRSFSGSGQTHGYVGSNRNFSRGHVNRGHVNRGYVKRGHGHGHYAYRRGHRHVYGYAPFGIYAYGGSCAYYYRRAIATGRAYWWDRYYDCIGD